MSAKTLEQQPTDFLGRTRNNVTVWELPETTMTCTQYGPCTYDQWLDHEIKRVSRLGVVWRKEHWGKFVAAVRI